MCIRDSTCTVPGPFTLDVNVVGGGSVDVEPDQVEYDCCTYVTLTAIPDECWEFVGWSGDLSGAVNPETIHMDSNKVITATFSKLTYDLTVTSDGCCPITVEYDGVSEEVAADDTRTFADIPCCTDVTLTAVVPEGCEFVEWSGDIAPNAPTDNPITIHMDSDKSVTAYCKSICVGPPWPVTLESGWNLLSTPILLDADSDTLEQIFDAPSLANIEVSYRWDIVEQQWRQVLADFELLPLEGIYVKIKPDATATATFVPSEELSGPPSRGLVEGLNLIGPAPPYEACEFPAMPLDQALVSIEEAPGGLRGYTMVISPGLNQPGWTYSLGGEIKDLLPYKGYWVVMENDDTLYGFSTTPVP